MFYKAAEGRLVSDPILFAVRSDLARFDAHTEQEIEAPATRTKPRPGPRL